MATVSRRLAIAAEPRIAWIERFLTNQVTIHLDTEANRTYTLQFTDFIPASSSATNGTTTATWSNLTVIPALPFANHYVLVDTRTSSQRFYRLHVSP